MNDTVVVRDRHAVICRMAGVLYDENGDMEGTVVDDGDNDEILAYFQENATILGIRLPTRVEVIMVLEAIMGCKYVPGADE